MSNGGFRIEEKFGEVEMEWFILTPLFLGESRSVRRYGNAVPIYFPGGKFLRKRKTILLGSKQNNCIISKEKKKERKKEK